VVAKTDIPARTKITASMVDVKLVAPESRSSLAYNDATAVIGQVTRFPIAANEQVLSTKVVSLTGTAGAAKALSFVVPRGKRAMAVTVSQVVSAGGLVLPGDYVDILVVYDVKFQSDPKNPASREEEKAFLVMTLLQNIEVLAVSQTVVDVVPEATPVAGQRVRNTESKPDPEAITVTLALTPEQAQILFLAESNGKIRMAVRSFGDGDEAPLKHLTDLELLPPNLTNPFLR
jgi:pilus assembly protein CpaB